MSKPLSFTQFLLTRRPLNTQQALEYIESIGAKAEDIDPVYTTRVFFYIDDLYITENSCPTGLFYNWVIERTSLEDDNISNIEPFLYQFYTDETKQSGLLNQDKTKGEVITLLSEAFNKHLYDTLTTAQFKECLVKIKTDRYNNCCPTHDYCDANMIMDSAFNTVLGRGAELQNEVDMFLWDSAWDMSRNNLYGTHTE